MGRFVLETLTRTVFFFLRVLWKERQVLGLTTVGSDATFLMHKICLVLLAKLKFHES